MNQNPFAFFAPDAGGYPQLQDSLGQGPYHLDARGAITLKEGSLPTSSLSHGSHDTDSSPSTPSKQRKSERRTPKSKAEVSERMRRWRSENAEKNRLNDLRCRVYRQARIRFGKDPTPEREAWIQSEIFRRLERRRLREVMKGNGSVPAPTAITNPVSMGMGHMSGGPITRSRSTVHPFPVHMASGQGGMPEHAMGFPASPYSMMAGGGIYGSGQPIPHGQHYAHADSMHHLGPHGYPGFAHHAHMQQQQQHQSYQQHHGQHYAPPHGYGHIQQQHHHQHHHNGHHPHHQHQQHQTPQSQPQQSHELIAGEPGALQSADLYGDLKFISPLYPGRLLPSSNGSSASAAPTAPCLYPEDAQQYMAHPPAQAANGAGTHSVPSQQPPHGLATSDAAAAAVAAAVAVADFSGPFQLPPAPPQQMYPYYQNNVAAFEPPPPAGVAEQPHSSPPTPTGADPPQYTLHAPDNPVYAVMSSSPPSSAVVHGSSAFTALSMVDPLTGSTLASSSTQSAATDGASLSDIKSGSHASAAAPAATVVATAESGIADLDTPSAEARGPGIVPSPSLNDVASNLFSLRQIQQPANGMLEDRADGGNMSVSSGLAAVAAAATASTDGPRPNGDSNLQQQQAQADAHHARHNMVQSPFNLGVVPDNIQFQNYS
ncbi:hypothetical protein H4R19_002437 [Coemansia spiralis]|nr:hypothetical protein H4R19_002437 [Coemansia spiralis]